MVRMTSIRNAAAGCFITASRSSAFLYHAHHPYSCHSHSASYSRTLSTIVNRIHSSPSVALRQHVPISFYNFRCFASKDESLETNKKRFVSSAKSTNKKGNKNSNTKKLFRADKVLATRASLTRSQAFDVLKRRRVAFRVTPESELIPVKGPKEKIGMDAILFMDGKMIPELPPILVKYHKPKFMLSAMDEKHSDKKHLGMILPDQYKLFHPVGRLDYDTSGLLLFSMDGELTQRLLHPKHNIEKEYVATVAGGKVDGEALKNQLANGVKTTEGLHFANLLGVEQLDLDQSQAIMDDYLKELKEKNENLNEEDYEVPLTDVRITVQEGKYRMVRRMLANCKHPVIGLRRERHGSVWLGDLQEGHFQQCQESEIEWAENLLIKNREKL